MKLRSCLVACSLALLAGSALALAACGTSEVDEGDERLGTAESAQTICPGNATVHGIDVSYYQGNVDWNAVAASGMEFAIARKSDGTFLDTKFQQNWDGIKSAGMIRGVYQYFEPDDDVATQAQIVIDAVGKLGPGDLPAMIDVEQAGSVSPSQYAAEIGQWLDLVEQGTGKRPMIYTGKYFWQSNVASSAYNDSALVHAGYPNACYSTSSTFVPTLDCWMASCPNIADQFDDWQFWQYTSEGVVDGIAGRVDMDIFDGDLAALKLLAGGGYAASLVSIDVPTTMVAGEQVTAHVTFKNVGGIAWDENTKIGASDPRDRSSAFADPSWEGPNRAAHVDGAVMPGDTYTFDFALDAPATPGAYTEAFGLVEEGVTWFADDGGPADDVIKLDLQVVAPPAVTSTTTSTGAGATTSSGAGGEGGEGGDTPLSKSTCDCEAAGSGGAGDAIGLGLFGLAIVARKRRRARR